MNTKTYASRLPWRVKLTAMLGVTAALTGCFNPTAETTKPSDAQTIADSLVYVKAKNGLCFGVGTTSRIDTGAKLAYSNYMVTVPCAAVGL